MISLNLKQRIFTSLVLLFIFFLFLNFNFVLVYTLILLGIFSILEFLSITKKMLINKYLEITSNILFISYIFLFCFMFYYLSSFALIKLVLYNITQASDLGGYCFGKIFKGPKLTKLSPKKTYSGAFGSILFSSFALSILIYLYTKNFDFIIILVGVFISIACQVGDLFFSFLKRKAKLKDTGNILPGHGGVLDRIDGLLFGIPIGLLSFIIFS